MLCYKDAPSHAKSISMTNRESRYVRVARSGYTLAQQALPLYTHAKSPHRNTWPQLAACVLLMFYLRLRYRDMEEWLLASERICQTLDLQEIPDHTMLCRAFHKLSLATVRTLERQLLDQLHPAEEMIAVDSTGFRLS